MEIGALIIYIAGLIGAAGTIWQVMKPFVKSLKKIESLPAELTEFRSAIEQKVERLQEHASSSDEADKCLLRERIRLLADKAIDKNSITQEEFESLEEMYSIYKKLGGNSFINKLVHKVQNLPIKG